MVATANRFIGSGLYTVPEAAWYARVSTAMMTRWLFGTSTGRSVIQPQFGASDRYVSFLDLVQTLAIREIRLQEKVPLAKFRQAIKLAKETFGIDYPFARQHFTYLLGDELVIAPSKDEYVEASGRHRGQRLFAFVETYLKNLSFDAAGLGNQYQIFKSDHLLPVVVTMNPQRRFGEPILPSGYTAMTIWEAIRSEGGIEEAATAYGIPKVEAETAYQFVNDHLSRSAA